MNEELVSLGLGTMVEPRGFIHKTTTVKFLQQLARQEKIAQVKGRGVWYGTDHVSSWNKMSQWVTGKVWKSSKDKDTSLPISAVAKNMSQD